MPPTKPLPSLASPWLASTAPSDPTPPSRVPTLVLASFGANDAAIEELSWFFQDALSEIEPQSNYSKTCHRKVHNVRTVANREHDDDEDSRADALHAARVVYGRLKKLTPEDLRVIRGLFEPRDVPESLQDACGWLAPLVRAMAAEAPCSDPEALQRSIDQATGDAARALAAYEAIAHADGRGTVTSREEV